MILFLTISRELSKIKTSSICDITGDHDLDRVLLIWHVKWLGTHRSLLLFWRRRCSCFLYLCRNHC